MAFFCKNKWYKRPRKQILLVYVGSVKDLISQKYSNITLADKVDYYGRKLNRATTLQTNWKPRIATVDNCFDLVGSRQYGAAARNRPTGFGTNCLLYCVSSEVITMCRYVDNQFRSRLFHFFAATPCWRDPTRSKQFPTVAVLGFQFGF